MGDKLSSVLFGLDTDELNHILCKNSCYSFQETEPRYEDKSPKKTNEVKTQFKLQYYGDDDVITLTFFDQLVLSACMTEFLHKNFVITPDIIFRDLGGVRGSQDICKEIIQSLQKLSNLEIELNAKSAARMLFQVKSDKFREIRKGRLLPMEEKVEKLNGQTCSTYVLQDMSVAFEYAYSKGHVVQIPITNLHVPKTKITYVTIVTRSYLYSRIFRISRKLKSLKNKQKVSSTIRLDTLYQVCGFTEKIKDKKFRLDLKKHIDTFLNHLVSCGVISGFQFIDDFKQVQSTLHKSTKIQISFLETETKK